MDAENILKKYFGYDSFRTGQENIIKSILSGRDVLAIMPTGAGKSICYQVPALLLSQAWHTLFRALQNTLTPTVSPSCL